MLDAGCWVLDAAIRVRVASFGVLVKYRFREFDLNPLFAFRLLHSQFNKSVYRPPKPDT